MAGMILKNTDTIRDRLDCIARFVIERERIRLRKEEGRSRPWTKDVILDNFHFCNVRRADDRVTKWIGAWAQSRPMKERWFLFAVARWFNEPEVLSELGTTMLAPWNPTKVKKLLKKRRDAGAQIFRGSYIITGAFSNKGQSKYEAVVDKVLTPLWKKPPTIYPKSIEASWQSLREYTGFGSFMAGQVVADWETFGIINGNDVKTWAPLGPGSARGLNWIFEPHFKIDQEDAVKLMRYVHAHLVMRDARLADTLSLHDVQNVCCEFSKYVRGFSKTKYVPYEPRLL